MVDSWLKFGLKVSAAVAAAVGVYYWRKSSGEKAIPSTRRQTTPRRLGPAYPDPTKKLT